MKRIVFVLGMLFIAGAAHAYGTPTIEMPVNGFGTPVTISISTDTGSSAAFVKVPSSQASGRLGIFVGIPSTNTGRIVGFFGNCTSTTNATSILPLQFAPGSNSVYVPLREDVCLWLITTHTAAENIHYQEVKQ